MVEEICFPTKMEGVREMIRVSFFENLSIGKKITLGFVLTGMLFFLVICQYHMILFQALNDSEKLQTVHGAIKNHSLNIHRYMLESRRSEKDFLVRKKHEYVERVDQYVNLVLTEAAELEKVENTAKGEKYALRIQELIRTYHDAFKEIVQAWQRKGLNHDSGLQGQFRKTIHEVEEKARGFKTSSLYLTLLQIRRAEKDLGLRLNEEYVAKVRNLSNLFHKQLKQSSLTSQETSNLSKTMDSYMRYFEIYATQVMDGKEIKGGKGPFRDVAHQLERYLQERYVQDLEINILTLRRREKDYLLRHDTKYIKQLQSAVSTIQDNISSSHISVENKKLLTGLVNLYKKDFLALVEENNRIAALTDRMRSAVHKIEPLVAANVQDAIMVMERETKNIQSSSKNKAYFALFFSLLAFLIAFYLSVVITRRITVPLFTLMRLAAIHTHDDEHISEDLVEKDEIRALASAMGRMDGTLTMTFNHINKEVESIEGSTEELLRISSEITPETEMETFVNAVKNLTREVSTAISEVKATLLPRLK